MTDGAKLRPDLMLDTLITSKTRIKLLLKFFLNSNNFSYLRNLESEFGDSSNSIRVELNKLEDAGLLNSNTEGNKKLFRANQKHPLFKDIQNILMKYTGLDQIVDEIIQKLGDVNKVYLIGALSRGLNSDMIDLIFIGNINKPYLVNLVGKSEKIIKKNIQYITYSNDEFHSNEQNILGQHHFLLWSKETHKNGTKE